jgi:RimJ/RimL family protein N-acetyltransferase
MSERSLNAFGQPVGVAIPGWTGRPLPPRTPMVGRYSCVEPLDPAQHADDLFVADREYRDDRAWTYLNAERPPGREAYRAWLDQVCADPGTLFHAVVDRETDRAVGLAAYLRIDPTMGSIEVGHLNFSPRLRHSRAATEAMALMMARAFDELGYRRYEWKCDSLNAPSRAAAKQLGFTFEGIFRQALVTKGRNRDTAWYSVLDREWPDLKTAFEQWLAAGQFRRRWASASNARQLPRRFCDYASANSASRSSRRVNICKPPSAVRGHASGARSQ